MFLIFPVLFSCSGRERGRASKSGKKTETVVKQASLDDCKGKVMFHVNSGDAAQVKKVRYFMDGSGSMFGYFNGSNDFKTVLSEFVHLPSFVKSHPEKEFAFACKKILPCDEAKFETACNSKRNAVGFIKRASYWENSLLNENINSMITQQDDSTISLFFTDGIYSISGVKSDALLSTLESKGMKTRELVLSALYKKDFQCLILQFSSLFQDKIITAAGSSIKWNDERPFYVFIVGPDNLINTYFSGDKLNQVGKLKNFVRFTKFTDEVSKSTPVKVSTFGRSRYKDGCIKAKISSRQLFGFTIEADFTGIPYDADYLTDTNNYSITDDYVIEKITQVDGQKVKLYVQQTETGNMYTNIDIDLLTQEEGWVSEASCDNDAKPTTDKTLGLDKLVFGIQDAYKIVNNNSTSLASIHLLITK